MVWRDHAATGLWRGWSRIFFETTLKLDFHKNCIILTMNSAYIFNLSFCKVLSLLNIQGAHSAFVGSRGCQFEKKLSPQSKQYRTSIRSTDFSFTNRSCHVFIQGTGTSLECFSRRFTAVLEFYKYSLLSNSLFTLIPGPWKEN